MDGKFGSAPARYGSALGFEPGQFTKVYELAILQRGG
jgi:hypothetical protein